MEIDKYFNYYLFGTITHLHNIVLMCILCFMIHVVIHFPLELMPSLCNFIHTFEEKIPQKGAYPLPIQFSNDCIYTCWANINQLLGDAVLVILLVIPRY